MHVFQRPMQCHKDHFRPIFLHWCDRLDCEPSFPPKLEPSLAQIVFYGWRKTSGVSDRM